ncbi:hypothetical protein [Mycoplasmoides pneumoniae]|uniref:Uncharacterized protein MPN_514 n=2 Tax=Mycoplasmoides pneumoniae TaxID=2104 RepID=Y514_MYCPN|nr:hypothetical protein [Mycoplasmoides pneumoniae]P75272.1 RecName: Full=Uncharacterized protein MPN_514 [Mycoplasmoides pneumoniae M129]AAB95976.1 conserved hypothetical protein [Mycoplasmoides pneumoniae M129]AJR19075.1 hypothetical protein C985_01265 [Mycoplasmoides pneumoniae M129-B7]ALA30387.1 hypothetical protein C897_02940 [Mycoplasmoides pneumoniae PI 1428]ALA32493.1 hypothetical protein F533_02940 [Mycoplasmoides pneumoniae 51494]ALA33193.1 hypothetical protein F530_02945 [Mycoplasm
MEQDINNQTGKKIFLNEECFLELDKLPQHVSVLGVSGFGKSNILLHFLKYAIDNDHPLIFVNGKGDKELITQFEHYQTSAKQLSPEDGFDTVKLVALKNTSAKIWSLDDRIATIKYNPFK